MLYKITYQKPKDAEDPHSEFLRTEYVQVAGTDDLPRGLAATLLGDWGCEFALETIQVEPVLDEAAEDLRKGGVLVRFWRYVR